MVCGEEIALGVLLDTSYGRLVTVRGEIRPATHGLLEEILDVLHAADVARLQEFPDLCSSGLFFRAAILSAAHKITSNVVLLFYTTSEVYTIFGMVST